MTVISVVVAVAVGTGVLTAAAVALWPRFDPAAAHITASSIDEAVEAHGWLRRFARRRFDPARVTGLALTLSLGAVLLGALGVGGVLLMVETDTGFARWDTSAARWGATNATAASSSFLRSVSQLGGTPAMIVIPLVLILLAGRHAPWRTLFGFFLVTVGGQSALVNLTKVIVDRSRPPVRHLTGFSGASFPSGHAAASAVLLAATALVVGRGYGRAVRSVLAGFAVGLTAAVAASRVLLGVHWLTDVLAGALLGWSWVALCSVAFGGRLLRFGRPAEIAADAAASPVAGSSRSVRASP